MFKYWVAILAICNTSKLTLNRVKTVYNCLNANMNLVSNAVMEVDIKYQAQLNAKTSSFLAVIKQT